MVPLTNGKVINVESVAGLGAKWRPVAMIWSETSQEICVKKKVVK